MTEFSSRKAKADEEKFYVYKIADPAGRIENI